MTIKSVATIYFSPTGTTKKIIDSILKGMNITDNKQFDLTNPKVRNNAIPQIESDIVIIGVPVYEERVPEILNQFLAGLKGAGKPVILVAVYGNFGYGIVLNELDFVVKNSGFKVIAASTFIGEHSFSTDDVPVQKGRPNCEDLKIAEEFGKSIIEKIQNVVDLNDIELTIPKGKLPIMAKVLPRNSARLFTKTPYVNMKICNHCGACARLCPMNVINIDTLIINEKDCIRCFSCVKRCPKKARKIIYKPKFIVSNMLRSKNKIKNNPEIFL